MKNITTIELIKNYKSIELRAHVNIDDVINKVTQETGEILGALKEWNIQEIHKEAVDTLVNILSASETFGIFPELPNSAKLLQPDPMDLIIHLSKWNQDIQSVRQKYSRNKITSEELKKSTQTLVNDILSYTNPEEKINQMIASNIHKFDSRVEEYKQKVDLKKYIKNCPDFPKKWINFKDISTLLANPEIMNYVIYELSEKCKNADIITWLDARWFIFGVMVANLLQKPFVMIRKKWKLPWETIEQKYSLEYWENIIEIQKDAIIQWQSVAIIDDLLATWWTINASINLIEKIWGIINNIACVISLDAEELLNMETRKYIKKYSVNSLVSYD